MNFNKKITKFCITAFTIISMLFICGNSVSASAIYKVNNEPIKIVSTKELIKNKVQLTEKNTIYVEHLDGVITTKDGYGHVQGYPGLEIYYGDLRYNNKPLPKGTKIKTLYFGDCFAEKDEQTDFCLARYDFAKLKVKEKIKKGKNKGKYKKVWKWIVVDCNGFNNREEY